MRTFLEELAAQLDQHVTQSGYALLAAAEQDLIDSNSATPDGTAASLSSPRRFMAARDASAARNVPPPSPSPPPLPRSAPSGPTLACLFNRYGITALASMSYLTWLDMPWPAGRSPSSGFTARSRRLPFSQEARIEAGYLLGRLQQGENLGLPHSRPMPSIGRRCHELRVPDKDQAWRIIYRIDPDAILILDVFAKTTRRTPQSVIDTCKGRLKHYDSLP
jgi:phage-related protein